MIWFFYIAAIITILASVKVVTSRNAMQALLYFVISLFATSVIFVIMDAYLSVFLIIMLFVGGVSLVFLLVLSLLKLRIDVIEQSKYGISPKIWLGPLILAFILLVTLIYGIANNDYDSLSNNRINEENIANLLMEEYILLIELAVLLFIGSLVIVYHFIHRIYINNGAEPKTQNKIDSKDSYDSINA